MQNEHNDFSLHDFSFRVDNSLNYPHNQVNEVLRILLSINFAIKTYVYHCPHLPNTVVSIMTDNGTGDREVICSQHR